MSSSTGHDRFFALLRAALGEGALVKLTLGKYRGTDPTIKNLFVRPVVLKGGPHLAFVWRHDRRDVTKNFTAAAGLRELEALVGTAFLDAHLFTKTESTQLETKADGSATVRVKKVTAVPATAPAATPHDAPKRYLIAPHATWLQALGVTNPHGQPREGMADKFRQIQKFAELLSHLVAEAFPPASATLGQPLRIVDMGSGKGYLTFAVAALLGDLAQVRGIEVRPELANLCHRIAQENGFGQRLSFTADTIAETPLEACDVLIALHACDTATDDALARGVTAGARLLVVAPCCQKELRRQLKAPPVLADALRHGIFQERQAEFATDALRAQLLEWAGYRTKVFEFISTEHTAKNVMIAAIKNPTAPRGDPAIEQRLRDFASFYGIRTQALAQQLGLSLESELKPNETKT